MQGLAAGKEATRPISLPSYREAQDAPDCAHSPAVGTPLISPTPMEAATSVLLWPDSDNWRPHPHPVPLGQLRESIG